MGMVTSQATTMSPATCQRTALGRNAAPAPRMDEETTWVVEMGKPKTEVRYMMDPDAAWEAKAWMGRMR